jgi:putative phosphoribosyl transferase
VTIPVRGGQIAADLRCPPRALGLVVFAHGSGSSRRSPRNRAGADVLQHGRFATLLLDLLTSSEERADVATAEFRFDIGLLSNRLVGALDWTEVHPATAALPKGLFGASTGAAAALAAAAARPAIVRALVSRGGRPDLAASWFDKVAAPTLLIVGGRDDVVIELNRKAMAALAASKELQIVEGATHLFEEPGALERVADLARGWFDRHLV